jgi:hypothetical protein
VSRAPTPHVGTLCLREEEQGVSRRRQALSPRRRESIDPVLKSWIDNVLVPALVDEWNREQSAQKAA